MEHATWEDVLPMDVWELMLFTFFGTRAILSLALRVASKRSLWYELVVRSIRHIDFSTEIHFAGVKQMQLCRLQSSVVAANDLQSAVDRLAARGTGELRRLHCKARSVTKVSASPIFVGLHRLKVEVEWFGFARMVDYPSIWPILSACPNLREAKFPNVAWRELAAAAAATDKVPPLPKKFVFLSLKEPERIYSDMPSVFDVVGDDWPNPANYLPRALFQAVSGAVPGGTMELLPLEEVAEQPTPTEGETARWFWYSSSYWSDCTVAPWKVHPWWKALPARSQFKIVKRWLRSLRTPLDLYFMAAHCRVGEWSYDQWYQIVSLWIVTDMTVAAGVLNALYQTSPQRFEECIYRLMLCNKREFSDYWLRIVLKFRNESVALQKAFSLIFDIGRYDVDSSSPFARSIWTLAYASQMRPACAELEYAAICRPSRFFANNVHVFEFLMAQDNVYRLDPTAVDRILEIWPELKCHTFKYRCHLSLLQCVAVALQRYDTNVERVLHVLWHLIQKHGCRDYIVPDNGHPDAGRRLTIGEDKLLGVQVPTAEFFQQFYVDIVQK